MTAKQMILANIEDIVRDLTESLNHAKEIEFASFTIQQALLDFADAITEIAPTIDELEKSDDLQYALKNLTMDLSNQDLDKLIIKCEKTLDSCEQLKHNRDGFDGSVRARS